MSKGRVKRRDPQHVKGGAARLRRSKAWVLLRTETDEPHAPVRVSVYNVRGNQLVARYCIAAAIISDITLPEDLREALLAHYDLLDPLGDEAEYLAEARTAEDERVDGALAALRGGADE